MELLLVLGSKGWSLLCLTLLTYFHPCLIFVGAYICDVRLLLCLSLLIYFHPSVIFAGAYQSGASFGVRLYGLVPSLFNPA